MAGEAGRRALVIIPLTGRECSQVLNQAAQVGQFVASGGICDLVEWRLDLLGAATEELLAQITAGVPQVIATAGVPVLATYRTRAEGGEGDPHGWEAYNRAAIEGGAQLVDVELTHADLPLALEIACGADTIVLSKHLFSGNGEETGAAVEQLRQGIAHLFDDPQDSDPQAARAAGADPLPATAGLSSALRRQLRSKVVAKLAVMVQDADGFAVVQDQLRRHPLPVTHTAVRGQLAAVTATNWGIARADVMAGTQAPSTVKSPNPAADMATATAASSPGAADLLTEPTAPANFKLDPPTALAGGIMITMGPAGKLGRTHPRTLGSCATFAALAGKASAPGQIDANELTALDKETGCLSLS